MKSSTRISASLIVLGSGLAGIAAADAVLPTYTATYQVLYKGKNVGSSEFSVNYDDTRNVYTFRSETRVKGMLRLLSPNPVVEHSDFTLDNGQIRPLEFWYEDGSRKGEDNFHAVFDWDAGIATIEGESNSSLELVSGVLDRGSMQVAVMRDMATSATPGPYMLADENALKTYEYSVEKHDVTETPLGELATVVYRQIRHGSSRSTSLWAAPTLRYLPVRIEQHKGGETDTVFILEAVRGLEATQ
jgi:hypothetical protein